MIAVILCADYCGAYRRPHPKARVGLTHRPIKLGNWDPSKYQRSSYRGSSSRGAWGSSSIRQVGVTGTECKSDSKCPKGFLCVAETMYSTETSGYCMKECALQTDCTAPARCISYSNRVEKGPFSLSSKWSELRRFSDSDTNVPAMQVYRALQFSICA